MGSIAMRCGLAEPVVGVVLVGVVLCCTLSAALAVPAMGSPAERIARDFLDALPIQRDFDAAALAAALTDTQHLELEALLTQFAHSRATLLKRTAARLEPACRLMLTIPQRDDQRDHLGTLDDFGTALERTKIAISGETLALRRGLFEQAGVFLGPTQATHWHDALNSEVRNRALDPRNRSAEGADLSAARDLETIPDLQRIASWAIRSGGSDVVDPELLRQVTNRLSEGVQEVQAAFDRWHRDRIIDTIRMQLASIRGDHRRSDTLTKRTQRQWADILAATLESSQAVADILDAGNRPDLARLWMYETNRRAFPTAFGRSRVDAVEDLLATDTSLSPQQRRSLAEVSESFARSRRPILAATRAALLHALQSGDRMRSELVVLRGVHGCHITEAADQKYRALIDSTIQTISDILDPRQRQAHAKALKQFSTRCDPAGDMLIW